MKCCAACHGTNFRGTVLSRAHAPRTLSGPSGIRQVWRGFQIGCYTCHLGPGNGDPNPNRPAVASGASVSTPAGVSIVIPLSARDPDGDPLTYGWDVNGDGVYTAGQDIPLANIGVSLHFDANGDGVAQTDELVSSAASDANGVALTAVMPRPELLSQIADVHVEAAVIG